MDECHGIVVITETNEMRPKLVRDRMGQLSRAYSTYSFSILYRYRWIEKARFENDK